MAGGSRGRAGSPAARPPRDGRRPRGLRDPVTLAGFVRNLQEGVYITRADGRILDANPAFLRMFGVRSLRELGRFTAEQLLVEPRRREVEMTILAREGAVREFEIDIRRPDGQVRTVLDTAYQVVDRATGEAVYHGILVDITDRKQLERQLIQAALRDPLTGCFNRRYLMEREQELERGTGPWGVVIVDVDHFKQYNDLHGHDTGDRVLVRVARFLLGTVRAEDGVFRIGGDEFLLLLTGAAVASTPEVARRLRGSGPHEVPVALSYGWAVRERGERLEETVRRADQRLIHLRSRRRRSGPRRKQEPGPLPGS